MSSILIIDDEESIRYTLTNFLEEEGYDVITASNYSAAIEQIDKSDFSLIITDILLEDKTGIDVLTVLREKKLTCPVIVITGYPTIDTAAEAVRLGAFDYIQKPVRQETIVRIASVALKHKAAIDEKEKYRSNLDAIFRSIKDAIIMFGKDMVIIELNEAAKKICGLSNKAIGKVFNVSSDKCNACLQALKETIETQRTVDLYNIECQLKNMPKYIIDLTTSPIITQQGIFVGAVMVVRDNTRLAYFEKELQERHKLHNIIGKSEKLQYIYDMIETLANVPTTVLITGESGTGKELVAEALHFRGNRRDKPLVKVNCSSLSESLLESELFGHVKGAFTGAVQDKIGRFEKAHGGTIFLDEIGDISPAIQQRLLRVLQGMEFERVGSSHPVKVDVRVIAATNKDLRDKVQKGEFRHDLYYRLKIIELSMPPLRERLEDIPLLINHFITKFNNKFGKDINNISSDVIKIFMGYSWHGNVRELEHALEHAFIVCPHNTIQVEHLPSEIRTAIHKDAFQETENDMTSFHHDRQEAERQAILEALGKAMWNKSKAAAILGISQRTLFRKIKEYKIQRNKI